MGLKKLCIVTPWSPNEGGVSLHSYELVNTLKSIYPQLGITVVAPCDNPVQIDGVEVISAITNQHLPDFKQFDRIIHVFTNNLYSNISFELIKKVGGVALLHESNMQFRLQVNSYLCKKGFMNDSYKYYSRTQISRTKKIFYLVKGIVRDFGFKWGIKHVLTKGFAGNFIKNIYQKAHYMDYINRYSDQMICLSTSNKERICSLTRCNPDKVTPIRFAHNPPSVSMQEQTDKGFAFGLFGHEGAAKHYSLVIYAFAKLCKMRPNDKLALHIVGAFSDKIVNLIEKLEILDKVRLVYKPSNQDWGVEMVKIDSLIALRNESLGEASGPVCQSAQLGIKSVVNHIGWFASLPDWLAYKVPVQPTLVQVLDGMQKVYLEGDRNKINLRKQQIAEKAKDYFSMKESARELATAINLT